MRGWLRLIAVLASSSVVIVATRAHGYNGGPLRNVTDLTTQCASCHSSVGKEQLRVEPEAFAATQLVESKHYKAIEDGAGGYKDMSPADRQKLLADVKMMDDNATVALSVSSTTLKPGQEVQITATVRGGHGVVGVWLMESDLRWQGRSIQSEGWFIVGAPKVWGADGKEQTRWVDSRGPGLKKNLNSVLIFDQQTDLAARKYADGKVTWTVRAPQAPGTYTVAAAFQYGTEKASPVGQVTTAAGALLPRGGPGGPSGHIKFSKVVTVTVQ
jgi:hypothetical protein